MNPQYPAPQQNPYSFITNTPPPQKQSLLGGGSWKGKAIIIGGLLALVIIAFMVISNILSSGSKAVMTGLKEIAIQQQELMRVADMGVKDATSTDVRNFAQTVSLTMQSDHAKTLEIVSMNKGKLTKEEQAAGINKKTDQALEAAKAGNRYDEVLQETLTSQINSYLAALKKTFDATSGPTTKENLSVSYNHAATLIGAQATN